MQLREKLCQAVWPKSGANAMIDAERIDLLIVDDDAEFRATVARRFARRGYQIQEAENGEAALALAEKRHFHAAIVDLMMPGMSGLELLPKLKAATPEMQVILLTGQGTIDSAVEAMKRGAFDYLTKPFPLAELEMLVQRALERAQLSWENQQLRTMLARQQRETNMIGQSPAMQEVMRLIDRAGPTECAILIQGESGTGKELVARALHRASRRQLKPLVTINCAALPETLLESELFGHEKGSFTGANAAKPGLFEVADGGTLFIDEIGEMPGSLQAKLLRVLENGELRRVGSLKERRVNVRLLAATNRKLNEEVKASRFREDLYYRINVMSLELPPLRERQGDIPLLVQHFLGAEWKIEAEAMQALEAFNWPGNVRQLANALERAKIMADSPLIRLRDLPGEVVEVAPVPQHQAAHTNGHHSVFEQEDAHDQDLAAIERTHIIDILRQESGNKTRAAEVLGINRRRLYRLLEKYHIEPTCYKGA